MEAEFDACARDASRFDHTLPLAISIACGASYLLRLNPLQTAHAIALCAGLTELARIFDIVRSLEDRPVFELIRALANIAIEQRSETLARS